jgi:hypothetical protein
MDERTAEARRSQRERGEEKDVGNNERDEMSEI